jgi:Icc protein
LQLTDTHLFAESSGTLLGLNTEQSLKSVIEHARQRHPAIDLVLATGDLAHDGSAAAYRRFFGLMDRFERPVYCLPGNHDEATILGNLGSCGHCITTDQATFGNWQFIFLDSTVPDSEGSHFSTATLQRLEAQLQASMDRHVLVCLHHQPVLMGSAWLDTMALDNADEFFAVIDRYSQVRGIVWGHVHQAMHAVRKRVQLMSAPSTCIQFLPGSKGFALDMAAPGYRWLHLHPDGQIESGIERTEQVSGSIDVAANGY